MKYSRSPIYMLAGLFLNAQQAVALSEKPFHAGPLKQLEAVQRDIYAIPNRTDVEQFGKLEIWRVADPRTGGDCEDHALAARQRLMALGWRPEELRIAVAWTEQGDYHVVLTVDGLTKKGVRQTYVLDNRFSHVETWSTLTRLGYRWDRRQDKTGQHWVAIAPKR